MLGGEKKISFINHQRFGIVFRQYPDAHSLNLHELEKKRHLACNLLPKSFVRVITGPKVSIIVELPSFYWRILLLRNTIDTLLGKVDVRDRFPSQAPLNGSFMSLFRRHVRAKSERIAMKIQCVSAFPRRIATACFGKATLAASLFSAGILIGTCSRSEAGESANQRMVTFASEDQTLFALSLVPNKELTASTNVRVAIVVDTSASQSG